MQHAASNSFGSTDGRVVILVDDDPDTCDLYAFALAQSGFVPIQAARSTEAQLRVQECLPDVIVTDMRLPDSSGLDMIRSLRADAHTCDIPVLVLTGCVFEADRQQAFEAGCDAFLTKPCVPEELATEIRRVLAIRHRQARLA
jgi:two-component system, cell cycle response regulator DivK